MSDKYDEEAEQIVRAHIDSGYLVEAVAAALRAKDEQIENWRVAASRLTGSGSTPRQRVPAMSN